jgi:ribose 5-phosphate isomerase B
VRVAVGSDERTPVTDALVAELETRGHEVVRVGPLGATGPDDPEATVQWAEVGERVGRLVATGDCATGVVCCWTGTGVSIAANKVPGVRAALCADATIAEGARRWNDANVLALGLVSLTVDAGRLVRYRPRSGGGGEHRPARTPPGVIGPTDREGAG